MGGVDERVMAIFRANTMEIMGPFVRGLQGISWRGKGRAALNKHHKTNSLSVELFSKRDICQKRVFKPVTFGRLCADGPSVTLESHDHQFVEIQAFWSLRRTDRIHCLHWPGKS